MFQMLQLVADGSDEGHEGFVDEQDLIFGVVEDIDQLFREQTWVDRMAHKTAA